MARTNEEAVIALLGDDYGPRADGSSPDMNAYISVATIITDDVNTHAASQGVIYTTARLERIECLLAAHYYTMSDKPYSFKGTEKSQAGFDGKTGMHLEATRYGPAAMELDSAGYLSSVGGNNGRQSVGGAWLGKRKSAQTDYIDRE